jgi:hypothetical protein
LSFAYYPPEPLVGELRDLLNLLDGERQELAADLGTDHPLFRLVDDALRSQDIDELRVARAACDGWPSGGKDNHVPPY